MNMEQLVECKLAGEIEVLRESRPSVTNATWPNLEMNMRQQGGKMATDWLTDWLTELWQGHTLMT
jgi:hypothetical protein